MMIVRKATVEDIPQILPLMDQLGYGQPLETLRDRFEEFLGQKGYGVAVADLKGQIVGCVAWSRSLLFISPKIRIHVEGLVVDTNHRGQSVGKRLMDHVENMARDLSPCIIDLTSGLRRAKDGSHDFYKALGYNNEGPMAKQYFRKEL